MLIHSRRDVSYYLRLRNRTEPVMSKTAQNKQSTPPTQFLCPISLEIMKDPVTLCTGQTYERANIQRWLASGHNTCPITMVKLTNCDLIPNHTLRRLIQDYLLTSNSFGLKKNDPPAIEMEDEELRKLVEEMESEDRVKDCLRMLCALTEQSVNDRRRIADAGAVRILISILHRDQKIPENDCELLQHVIFLLSFVPLADEERRAIADPRPLECILWFLHNGEHETKIHAVRLLRKVAVVDDVMMLLGQVEGVLSGLVLLIRDETANKQGQKSALKTMFQICLPQCNRLKGVESGAIQAILDNLPIARKKNTERGLSVLTLLCAIDEGRQALLDHPFSFTVLLQTLHTSAKATEAAITTLWNVVSFNADAATQQFLRLQAEADAIFSKLLLLLHGDYSHSAKYCAINLLKSLRASCSPSRISGLDVLDAPRTS